MLKRLIAALLSIQYEDIEQFTIISILGFNQFPDPAKFHSEFQALEVTTHEPLTDKMVLHYYELKKLSPLKSEDSGRDLWLRFLKYTHAR